LGKILVAVLFRTLNNGCQINFLHSTWICKIREFLADYFTLISLTCICLATMDQYLSLTRSELSQLHFAHQSIPFLISCDPLLGSCKNLNLIYSKYSNYFVWLVLLGPLPVFVMLIFSLLSFNNVRKI